MFYLNAISRTSATYIMVRLKRVKEDRDTTFIGKKNSERKNNPKLRNAFNSNTLKLILHAVSANGFMHSFLNGGPR